MPREDRFREGDVVTKGDETGRVVQLRNRRTGEPFLTVWIHSGPRKNQREYPWKGWTPRLDHGTNEGTKYCANCRREFAGERLEVLCRTCVRPMRPAVDQPGHLEATGRIRPPWCTQPPRGVSGYDPDAARRQRERDDKDSPF